MKRCLGDIGKMCQKKPYQNRKIDDCLVDEINALKTTNWNQKFQSIMSCCGHGKYPKTLIVKNRASGKVFEWYSGIDLTKSGRARKRQPYYKKDAEGYYFIPEVSGNK